MNICMVGYGMMGTWHSDALKTIDCNLHTLVGRREEAAQEFAARYGYDRWTTRLEEALNDDEIDVVILANPSEQHATTALASASHGKHTLVEIPIAMSLADSEQIVQAARDHKVKLGVVHPLRLRPEMLALLERVHAGEETIRHYGGRFFIHRLSNVGATGYKRSWTDNLLWHHTTHLLDLGLWLLDFPEPRQIHSFVPALDPMTEIPMEVFLGLETAQDQSLVCTGSYYGHQRFFDAHVVTDRESYMLDVFSGTWTTSKGTAQMDPEAEICGRVAIDFVEAVREDRPPAISGESVLSAMQVLQVAQDRWDAVHGVQSIPGRPL